MFFICLIKFIKSLECFYGETSGTNERFLCLVFERNENIKNVLLVKNQYAIEECKEFKKYSSDLDRTVTFLSALGFEYIKFGQEVDSFYCYEAIEKDSLYSLYCFNHNDKIEKFETIVIKTPDSDYSTFTYIDTTFLDKKRYENEIIDLINDIELI